MKIFRSLRLLGASCFFFTIFLMSISGRKVALSLERKDFDLYNTSLFIIEFFILIQCIYVERLSRPGRIEDW
ncbi:hypothetical protein CA223_19725 [Sphingomonas koreensis]|jgi:hypothetical protein|uniref:Uncharacterized protein n=1 Tax=Sphingomonas koreensis TaxID=93064 RepID=A0A1L6JDU3_9SPHN|nr:hypothetical protein BRX40_15685 [Sphingomonas koreensis]RSU24198.1 hypothetical protein CA224_00155 [Sphingomonas koreensis]RSU25901.1 hypothetical protein CA222_10490 [Sphingomonas koreensis]RSU26045.1 hypothetical protein CA222_11325 [Sphingomonas koreensis]RSU27938.1 hypothetical protein CA225_09775 [Sphingomonas koreensis]